MSCSSGTRPSLNPRCYSERTVRPPSSLWVRLYLLRSHKSWLTHFSVCEACVCRRQSAVVMCVACLVSAVSPITQLRGKCRCITTKPQGSKQILCPPSGFSHHNRVPYRCSFHYRPILSFSEPHRLNMLVRL